MKPELRNRWIKALRSGEYKKATSVLKRFFRNVPAKHCCIGVLCELVQDDFDDAKDLIQKRPDFQGHLGRTSVGAIMDFRTLGHVGLSVEHQRTLTNMNDKGASFERIANYIERKL
jgi:hypothetical protein